MIADVANTGCRSLAVKLARKARQTSGKLARIRAFPQIVLPCPLPSSLLRSMSKLLHHLLLRVPGFCRNPQHRILLSVGKVIWSKSPTADAVLAPSFLPPDFSVYCQCTSMCGNRVDGHLCARNWSEVQPCRPLASIVGERCLTYRIFPSLSSVLTKLSNQVRKVLLSSGLPRDQAKELAQVFSVSCKPLLQGHWNELPPWLKSGRLKAALQSVHRSGLVFIRIDRNPGRLVVMCSALWVKLQQKVFLQCNRYEDTSLNTSNEDHNFADEHLSPCNLEDESTTTDERFV